MALASKSNKSTKTAVDTKTAAKALDPENVEVPVEETYEPTPEEMQEAAAPEVVTPEVEPKREEKAVAVKKKAAAPAKVGIVKPLDAFENALPPIDFGTLPRVNAKQSEIYCEDGSLGKNIEVTILSFNNSFAVSPNDNAAPKDACKFSYDGVELNDGSGTTVAEHLAMLKEDGWEKAAAKRYVEVIAMLDDAETDSEEIGGMVQLSLSPQSVKQFDRYQLGCMVKLAHGTIEAESLSRMRVTAKVKTFGSNTFTMMQFSSAD